MCVLSRASAKSILKHALKVNGFVSFAEYSTLKPKLYVCVCECVYVSIAYTHTTERERERIEEEGEFD